MAFTTALLYPYAKVSRLVYTVLLLLVPFVNVISGIWVLGYLLQVANASRRGEVMPPPFSGPLFIPGLKVLVLSIIYAIPVWLCALVTLVSPTLGSVLVVVVSLAIYYIGSVALVHFAAKGSFSAAFQFGEIMRRAVSKPFLLAWVQAVVLALLYGLIAYVLTILTAITVVGPYAVLIIVASALMLSAVFLFGKAYAETDGSIAAATVPFGVRGRRRV